MSGGRARTGGSGLVLALDEANQARVQFNIDRLAEMGPLRYEAFTKELDGKLRELRFYLDGRPTRITYWIASGRRNILLTVFVKTQRRDGVRSNEASGPTSGASPKDTPPRRTTDGNQHQAHVVG